MLFNNTEKQLKNLYFKAKIYQPTLNANFSRKCEIPLGYATSYLEPESITTVKK
jgi:hypothetical protein